MLILEIQAGDSESILHFAIKFKLQQKLLIFEALKWRVLLWIGYAKLELVQIYFETQHLIVVFWYLNC